MGGIVMLVGTDADAVVSGHRIPSADGYLFGGGNRWAFQPPSLASDTPVSHCFDTASETGAHPPIDRSV